MMRHLRAPRRSSAAILCLLATGACAGADGPALESPDASSAALPLVAPPVVLVPVAAARVRLEELRARFVLTPGAIARGLELRAVEAPRPAIAAGVIERFERELQRVRPLSSATDARGIAHHAAVELPVTAAGEFALEDETHLAIRVALTGAREAPIETADGLALYRGALRDADVVHRVRAEGTEDYVAFERRPAREELAYDVDVSRVAGLRLVSNTLEFLDARGTPRLRVAPPYVVDARRARAEARIAVDGCAYDENAAAPWGRGVTAPGARRCVVRVSWGGVVYPALVDPVWSVTGSMATARDSHAASALSSGQVLIVAGANGGLLSSAELYDPASGTFAATGSLAIGCTSPTASLLGSGKVLVAGGRATYYRSAAELYDPMSGAFTAGGAMSNARGEHTASLLRSGEVLIVGGTDDKGSLASSEIYDPTADAFRTAGALKSPRYKHTASVLGSGAVLIVGGSAGNGALAASELYDPTSATFTPTGALQNPRLWHTASELPSGEVLIAGGLTGSSYPASAELFDPTTQRFRAAGSMTSARWSHTASVLPSGRVLLAGGSDGSRLLASAELYDPNTRAFRAASPMLDGRFFHTASVLPSGEVLVAGGFGSGWLATADRYRPVAIGGACTQAGDCVSGYCSDGVCCDAPCAGGCDVCSAALGAAADGACTVVPAGYAANPPCPAPYRCDGGGGACPTLCASDASCASGYACVGGACEAQRALGAACPGGDSQCASGLCVDGYCCDAACTGVCEACDVGGQRGTCSPVAGAPHGGRPACEGAGACAATCDGASRTACGPLPGASVPCAPARCDAAAGKAYAAAFCDGLGACSAPSSTSCGGYLCNGAACGSACATSSECASGWTCAEGVCAPITGGACTKARDCASGFCVDGVCCDGACEGQCEACDVPGKLGACAPVAGAPHGARAPCTDGAGDACRAMRCDGAARSACAAFAPRFTECVSESCTGATHSLPATCDGAGSCQAPKTTSCAPYACGATACKTSCATASDCAAGYECKVWTCTPKAKLCSEDGTALIDETGQRSPCDSYVCRAGACLTQCTSGADCAQGRRCDATGACVPGTDVPAPQEEGGCATRRASGAGSGGGALFALLAFAALRVRRARRPIG